ANAGRRLLQDWFRGRDGKPTKQNWPSSGIWGQIAAGTSVQDVTPNSATLAVAHPAIRMKVLGSAVLGPITPKRGKFLAVPASAEAYAAGSPREGATPQLEVSRKWNEIAQRWMWCLFAPQAGFKVRKDRRKGREGQMRASEDKKQPPGIWYWLVRSANVPADPDALPPDDLLRDATRASALAYLATAHGARSQL
ncbi:MAG TPA: hypothetical protein P5069_11680, partial [Candidatus Hydrogenedentes bacterium]|nr:hypothetical protein [Candidatus Hydrogenedentota bacterium]